MNEPGMETSGGGSGSTTPSVVVVNHHPWYPNGTKPSTHLITNGIAATMERIKEDPELLLSGRDDSLSVNAGGRCARGPLPCMEDEGSHSDTEVSRISAAGVQMRIKRKKRLQAAQQQQQHSEDEESRDAERPMSWEGELSDAEMSRLDEAIVAGRGAVLAAAHLQTQQHLAGVLQGTQHYGEEEASMEGVQCGGASPPRCSPPPLPLQDVKPSQLTEKAGLYIATPEHINEQALKHQQQHQGVILPSGPTYTPSQSPLTQRHVLLSKHPPTPSPDSAIHSAYYSPTQSPVASRHPLSSSGFSSPYSTRHATPSLSRTSSDASQYSTGSCYSSPAQFSSPSHSPVQTRHPLHLLAHSSLSREFSVPQPPSSSSSTSAAGNGGGGGGSGVKVFSRSEDAYLYEHPDDDGDDSPSLSAGGGPAGISRQQLINSPCPICGDKISGFHYGIFSCESCKGFFKRTVQNRKNYVCLRGSACPVTIATRKKCPACRFDKCLKAGMKLEAIREDRTRGGRSTYQCSYTLPSTLLPAGSSGGSEQLSGGKSVSSLESSSSQVTPSAELRVKTESCSDLRVSPGSSPNGIPCAVPSLLQEIMDVEHLWHHEQGPTSRRQRSGSGHQSQLVEPTAGPSEVVVGQHDFLQAAAASGTAGEGGGSPDFIQNLCSIADHRLYKIVKWCKSLPLFKNISIDDQISLLINSWCELLLFSCCFRSMSSPGEIRVSLGKSLSLERSRALGLGPCIERMLNFTEHLRRLRLDKYEFVAMKVIVLLTSDTSDLREPEKVRASQEKVLEALQHYTLHRYPDLPSKFGELLLRIPELQRACQVGKEMLSLKNKDGEGPASFNLLMELLRGDH